MAEQSLVEIRNSRIHGSGAYAKADIAAGTYILEYVGEKITKEESNRRCQADNRFIFCLDAEHDLDGSVAWNPARFFNHSCAPNCETIDDDGHIWVVAIRDIEAGEELTYNYGFDLESYRDYPCRCGTADCVGYIVAEEFFPLVRRRRRYAGDVKTPWEVGMPVGSRALSV